jgi:hypothetical protein
MLYERAIKKPVENRLFMQYNRNADAIVPFERGTRTIKR